MNIGEHIRIINDFPKEGISFKDITTLLKNGEAFKYTIKEMAHRLKDSDADLIVGPEARGFILGAAVAYELGAGFIPVRKTGKLPSESIQYKYELEYGTDTLEMHTDAIKKGEKVAIVDDLLATGGTILSTINMIEKLGGIVVHIVFLIELEDLKGRAILSDYNISSIIKYKH